MSKRSIFKKTLIVAGLLTGAIWMTAPAHAAGIGKQMSEAGRWTPEVSNVVQVRNQGMSPRRLARRLSRQGLYPVSQFRIRRGTFRVRAENDNGRLFRVVGDAWTGEIFSAERLGRRGRRNGQFGVAPRQNFGWNPPRQRNYGGWNNQRPRRFRQGGRNGRGIQGSSQGGYQEPALIAPPAKQVRRNRNRAAVAVPQAKPTRQRKVSKPARKKIVRNVAPSIAPSLDEPIAGEPRVIRLPDTDGSMR